MFWRFLGLALVPVPLVLAAGVVFAVGAGHALATSTLVGAGARVPVIGFWVLLALTAILIVVGLAIAVSIALAYAQRIVVVEDVGVVAAVAEGWRVLRAHLGPSLLTWLINIGLTIGAQLAVGAAMAVALGLLVGIGLAFWALVGFSAVIAAYAALGTVVAVALFWGMEAIVHTFLWSYWTLAYLRLTGNSSDVYWPLVLYQVFKPVSRSAAALMVILSLVGLPISLANELNQFAVLAVLHGTGPATAVGPDQVNALVSLFLSLHASGTRIAQIFWGLWLFPYGYLVYKSGFIPGIFGVLLMLGCFGYLIPAFAEMLSPGVAGAIGLLLALSSTGELLVPLWLAIRGVSAERWSARARGATALSSA